ncbi:beta-1,3-galactosyltransferase 1-like [Drosophila miranda]|uniref:beta-1,3-galactosyltransferase 1-like n=1 Tax=Drosophila miranda TaxID=7229 RepID=UPI0007E61ADB|nr:beta-1,3-galactosyltransferase 1-like [Drosophila miranda]
MYHVYQFINYQDLLKRNTPLSDWTIGTSLNLSDYISPLDDTALIVPRGFCKSKTLLLIVVASSVNGYDQRQDIRETWGNTTHFNYPVFAKLHSHLKGSYRPPMESRLRLYSDFLSGEGETLTASVQVVFLLGRSKYSSPRDNESLVQVWEEAYRYNDILQEDFIDTYNNLTLKSVLALKQRGTVPLYNDSILYTSRWQSSLRATNGVMLGNKFTNSQPLINVNSKWYMPYYMYPHSTYLEYLSGGGYLLSIDAVQRLYEAAWSTRCYLEDIYVTGLYAQQAHLKPRHSSLFTILRTTRFCSFKAMIIQHQVKGRQLRDAWKFFSDYIEKCAPPDPIVD